MISFVCVGPYHTSTNEFYSEIMKSVKVLPTLSILLPAVSVAQAARPLRGIRIVSPANPVTIYLNGERVLSVTNSCFIANLKSGDCRIEAYDGYGDNKRDGSPVFSEIVRHSGREVTEISVENRSRACSTLRRSAGRSSAGLPNMIREEAFDANRNTLLSTLKFSGSKSELKNFIGGL